VSLAACHASGGAKPRNFGVQTFEVKNDTPCDAPVRVQTYGGELVMRLGTVPAGTTQSFDVLATLIKGNSVTADPLEPDGTLCRNNPNFWKRVVVRKLTPPSQSL
jgi:hypothetical protein